MEKVRQEKQKKQDQQNVLLFHINQIPYHGNKKIIYDHMLMFKDNQMIEVDQSEPPTLEGNLKQYLINIYFDAIMNHWIDLNQIDPVDIFDFLKFLEQYPADNLSPELIEMQLIDYFNLHDIVLSAELIQMFHRCCMRLMYLYVNHPKVYESLCCRECEGEGEKEEEYEDEEVDNRIEYTWDMEI